MIQVHVVLSLVIRFSLVENHCTDYPALLIGGTCRLVLAKYIIRRSVSVVGLIISEPLIQLMSLKGTERGEDRQT